MSSPRTPEHGNRLRPLHRPRPLHVRLGSDDLPAFVRFPGRPARKVAAVRESWRIDDEWWRDPISRRYFEVVLNEGGQFVIYSDLLTGEWFAQL